MEQKTNKKVSVVYQFLSYKICHALNLNKIEVTAFTIIWFEFRLLIHNVGLFLTSEQFSACCFDNMEIRVERFL